MGQIRVNLFKSRPEPSLDRIDQLTLREYLENLMGLIKGKQNSIICDGNSKFMLACVSSQTTSWSSVVVPENIYKDVYNFLTVSEDISTVKAIGEENIKGEDNK